MSISPTQVLALRVRPRSWRGLTTLTALSPLLLVAACSNSSSNPSGPSGVLVKASDTACEVATTTFRSGLQTFSVSNAGSQVTAVFFYAAGDRVVGEVGNIGPSTSKRLTVALKTGRYDIACKPGMAGNGIRTAIIVKATSGDAPTTSPQLDAAVATYRTYVLAQARLLATRTAPFVAAVEAGDISKAKSLYAAARVPYEVIEPIAQSLGDLDPRINARIDEVENGQEWTGFHRLEHDLWKTADVSKDGPVATRLQSDIARLVDQVQRVELSADQIGNGAKSLLHEVASSGVTGEEELYSGLDLVDVAANVQGAAKAYEALRPVVLAKDPELVTKIDARFVALQVNLGQFGSGVSFQPYDTLSKTQIRSLATDIQALIEPFADFTPTALKA